jgi:hypothetical protein
MFGTSATGDRQMTKAAGYIINEANGDRHAGSFKTYEAAVRAMKRYDADDMERCQPSIGRVLENGNVTYEI